MNADQLLRLFDRVSEAEDAVPRMRRFVLDLAVRGKLVPQEPGDEPASELLKRIEREKVRLVKAGEIRKPKAIENPEQAPFDLPAKWAWSNITSLGIISPRNEAEPDAMASFVPMPLIPTEIRAANGHEPRQWREIKKGYTHFAEGDVGLAKITPCFENGKSAVFRGLTGGFGAGTTELHIVRPLFVSPDYILTYLKSPQFIENGIPRMTGTAGQKRVPTDYFIGAPFPLPPLAEQHRIVAKVEELMALLDRIEAARAGREETRNRLTAATLARLTDPKADAPAARFALDTLAPLTTRPDQIKTLRQTILNLAVRGKLVPQDPADEPASELLTRATERIEAFAVANRLSRTSPQPVPECERQFELPTGWQWSRLNGLFNVITDGDHQPPPKSDGGVAFLTIGNVTTGVLDFSVCRTVPESYYKGLASYRTPAKGDILYTVVGATYGRPALVATDRPFCVQRHIAIMKPCSEIDVGFLLLVLRSPLIYDQACKSITGTAQPTIALRPLRSFVVAVPPIAEQHRIVAKVDALMRLLDDLEAALSTSATTRARLLDATLRAALAEQGHTRAAA
ncbi:restriction endonuclease subunit S (plasmid) [Cereibacter azotoformans]|uniref:restriction endonuclease subunit S n=1 Tax=Cereibacter azotoformans TaxID=43057 RepID=UPI003B227DE2